MNIEIMEFNNFKTRVYISPKLSCTILSMENSIAASSQFDVTNSNMYTPEVEDYFGGGTVTNTTVNNKYTDSF